MKKIDKIEKNLKPGIPGKDLVFRELEAVEKFLRSHLSGEMALIRESADSAIGSGGKRLRPTLVLLAASIFPPGPGRAVAVAATMEIIHVSSLLHDDVVDNSPTRRGNRTVNSLGGDKLAILLADFLLARALSGLCREETMVVLRRLSQAVTDMAAGQIAELSFRNNFSITEEDYLAIIRRKTASLISASCAVGGMMAGAGEKEIKRLAAYGENLGMAFQITDDCLDIWGKENLLGKPTGGDLADKKMTLPLIHLLKSASGGELAFIRECLGNGRISRTSFRRIRILMENRGSHGYALARAARYCAKARKALEGLPPSDGVESLLEMTDYVMEREN
jgi:octaprenyl-diphosphate synthase